MTELARWYLERDGVPTPVTLDEWLKWAAADYPGGTVGLTTVKEAEVSTVFLSLEHHPPGSFYETMIFRGPHDLDQWRYRTRAEALAGHTRIVDALVRGDEP